MKSFLSTKITSLSIELLVFFLIIIFIFNELAQFLETLGLFDEESMKMIERFQFY